MGSSASKPLRSAAGAAARQYPKQPSPSTRTPGPATKPPSEQSKQGPVYHSKEKASTTKSEAIDLDARDPHFAASLRSIGPVTPSPTFSNSSTFNRPPPRLSVPSQPDPSKPPPSSSQIPTSMNPTLLTLSARDQIARAAESELESFGRESHTGRQFLDVVTIKQILSMRDREGASPEVIERHFRLKKGVVAQLGAKGVVSDVRDVR